MMETRLLIMAAFLATASPLTVAMNAGVSIGSRCSLAIEQIREDWFTLKDRMVPPDVRITRPGARDLYCVSPSYVRNAVQRPITSQMTCFTFEGSDEMFCCTAGFTECAALNPAAIDEARAREKKRAERRAARKAKKEAQQAERKAKKAAEQAAKEDASSNS